LCHLKLLKPLKPQPQGGLYVAHGIGTSRLSELGIIDDCVPRGPCYVIQDISGVKAEVEVQAVFQAESPAETGVHGKF
jgi:hypothetical protein